MLDGDKCLDGYQMALQGRAGAALSVAAIGSWIAGTGSIVLLMAFARPCNFTLSLKPAEFFALTLMAFGLLTVFGGRTRSRSSSPRCSACC